jgi:hypothetical protein
MKVKTFQKEYELSEFSYYLDDIAGECISVLDLVVQDNKPELVEEDLSNLFAIETDHHAQVFSGYEISECYLTDDNLTKVVCIK